MEPAGRDVFEPGAVFEVADGELDGGVLTMEPIDFDDVAVEIGEERVVPPVGPQLLLGSPGEPGAAHDQSAGELAGRVGRLGDLGLAAVGVLDVDPGVLVDASIAAATVGNPQRTAIVNRTSSRLSVAMVSFAQNPESIRIVIWPVAPARRARATSSSMNRRAPRWVFAEPLRIRACTISPVSARVARIG